VHDRAQQVHLRHTDGRRHDEGLGYHDGVDDSHGLEVGPCPLCSTELRVSRADAVDRRTVCARCGTELCVAFTHVEGGVSAAGEPLIELSCRRMLRPPLVESLEGDALVLRLVYASMPWFYALLLVILIAVGVASVATALGGEVSFGALLFAGVAVLAARRLIRHFTVDRRRGDEIVVSPEWIAWSHRTPGEPQPPQRVRIASVARCRPGEPPPCVEIIERDGTTHRWFRDSQLRPDELTWLAWRLQRIVDGAQAEKRQ